MKGDVKITSVHKNAHQQKQKKLPLTSFLPVLDFIMTKKDSGHQQKKKQHGGHQQKQHNVVSHNKPKEKHHNREHDPVYIGSGDIKEHTYSLSDNLTKKDKHMVEKLEAQMEYADAHDNPDEAHKLEERIQAIMDKADARTKVPHDAKVQVVHHGGHKHKHEQEA